MIFLIILICFISITSSQMICFEENNQMNCYMNETIQTLQVNQFNTQTTQLPTELIKEQNQSFSFSTIVLIECISLFLYSLYSHNQIHWNNLLTFVSFLSVMIILFLNRIETHYSFIIMTFFFFNTILILIINSFNKITKFQTIMFIENCLFTILISLVFSLSEESIFLHSSFLIVEIATLSLSYSFGKNLFKSSSKSNRNGTITLWKLFGIIEIQLTNVICIILNLICFCLSIIENTQLLHSLQFSINLLTLYSLLSITYYFQINDFDISNLSELSIQNGR